jgi:tubulin monoglycylase TTLL3/8
MENPMIIKSKKFDIRYNSILICRQWVLVQDYDPPRIWFFDECYVRFSAEEFDIDNLNNKYCLVIMI